MTSMEDEMSVDALAIDSILDDATSSKSVSRKAAANHVEEEKMSPDMEIYSMLSNHAFAPRFSSGAETVRLSGDANDGRPSFSRLPAIDDDDDAPPPPSPEAGDAPPPPPMDDDIPGPPPPIERLFSESPPPPPTVEDIEMMEAEELEKLAEEMSKSISTVRSKFSCMEAVRWLVCNGKADSEADAVDKGNAMLKAGLLHIISGSNRYSMKMLKKKEGSTEPPSLPFLNSPAVICKFANDDSASSGALRSPATKFGGKRAFASKWEKGPRYSELKRNRTNSNSSLDTDDLGEVIEEEEEEDEDEEEEEEEAGVPAKLPDVHLADYFVIQRLFACIVDPERVDSSFKGTAAAKWLKEREDMTPGDILRIENILFLNKLIKSKSTDLVEALEVPGAIFSFSDSTYSLILPTSLRKTLGMVGPEAMDMAKSADESIESCLDRRLRTLLLAQAEKACELIKDAKQRLLEGEMMKNTCSYEFAKAIQKQLKHEELVALASAKRSKGDVEKATKKLKEKQKNATAKEGELQRVSGKVQHYEKAVESIDSLLQKLMGRLSLSEEIPEQWNHLDRDVVGSSNLFQAEVLISCTDLHVKKKGFTKLALKMMDSKGKKQNSFVRIMWGMHFLKKEKDAIEKLNVSSMLGIESPKSPKTPISPNTKSPRNSKKGGEINDESIWFRPEEEGDGDEEEGETYHRWVEVGKTDVILSENPTFPCALLIEARNVSPRDVVKFEIHSKVQAQKKFSLFGTVVLSHADLIRCMESGEQISLDVDARRKSSKSSPTMHLTIFKPNFFGSQIAQNYCHIGQSYQLPAAADDDGDSKTLTIREQCVELSYTWQVPVKFLQLRVRELEEYIAVMDTGDFDDLLAIRNTLHMYKEQLVHAEEEYRKLAFTKEK